MRKAIALAALASLWVAPASAEPVGEFGDHADVGEVSTPGSVTVADGAYRMTASGANIWGSEDAFHYAWTQRSGDLHIAADIAFEGAGGDPHRKAGLMIRQNLTPGSPYADVMVHGDGMVSLQYREVQDGPTRQIVSAVTHPRRVRLEREGDFVYFSVAGADGALRACRRQLPHRLPGAVPGRPRALGAQRRGHRDRDVLERRADRAAARLRARHRLRGAGRGDARGDRGRQARRPPGRAPFRRQDRSAQLEPRRQAS